MRCDWQNSMSLFFVGILFGGGSLYIIERPPSLVSVSTMFQEAQTPLGSAATSDATRSETGHGSVLADLPVLRQYPAVRSGAKSVKTPEYRTNAAPGMEFQPGDPSNSDTFYELLEPNAGLQHAAIPRNTGLEAPTLGKTNAVSVGTFDRSGRTPAAVPILDSQHRAEPGVLDTRRGQGRARSAGGGVSRTAGRPSKSSAGQLPHYEILHAISEFNSTRIYAEVLIPDLPRDMPAKSLKRLVKAIAEHESFDSMTVYRTRLARKAHYSMSFADAHPQALAEGLVGNYRRGRFKAHKPKTR